MNRFSSLAFRACLSLSLFALSYPVLAQDDPDSETALSDIQNRAEDAKDKGSVPGRFQEFRPRPGSARASAMSPDEIAEIEALGYLSGVNPAGETAGVILHDKTLAQPGLNFWVSGHAPEALLMDMDGNLIHKWGIGILKAIPAYATQNRKFPNHWRRAHLAENGDVIGIYGGYGMVKVDKNSKLLWSFGENVHHDLEVMEDGTIYTLTRKGTVIPRLARQGQVVMDYVVVLSPDGEVLDRFSVFDCFLDSRYESFIPDMKRRGDVLHTNTIEVFDGSLYSKASIFRKGNILLSMRDFDMICIVDGQTKKVIWALKGLWRRQHQPVLIDSGNMLVFDNTGLGNRSQVLEFDPLTQAVTWDYGSGKDEHFYTRLLGSVQRLKNGNTLISESDNGRIFEVTPSKKIVWEFITPYRAGENNEFVASVYELVRLSEDFPVDWADPESLNISIDISETSR